jgi:hypothetical protein
MQVKTIIKTIIQAVKDEIEILRWRPEVHNITNSKCIEFDIKPLCPYCHTKQYNTCLIECHRQNILLAKQWSPADGASWVGWSLHDYDIRYHKYMVCAVKQWFPEYQYIVDKYENNKHKK